MLDCRIPLITASTGYEPLTQSERTASFCSSQGFFIQGVAMVSFFSSGMSSKIRQSPATIVLTSRD
jgi:hypothetical protein